MSSSRPPTLKGINCNWRHLLPPTALKGPPWTQPLLALRTLVHGSLPRPEASAGGRGGLGWRVHLTVLVHDLRTLVHGPLPRPEASAGGRGGSGHYSRASLCLGNKASKVMAHHSSRLLSEWPGALHPHHYSSPTAFPYSNGGWCGSLAGRVDVLPHHYSSPTAFPYPNGGW